MPKRRLEVEVVGDADKLRRELNRASGDVTAFGRKMDTTSKKLAAIGTGRAFLGGFVASAALTGAKQFVDIAKESELVLGQTRVALESAGKSWATYGSQIEKTIAAQSRLGFDDEQLLKTFSSFVRTTDDVTKALDLNALAADVARGRYIDLEQAAQIVTKAALGQSGALRRIGIDAQKGATATELLTLLTQKYGGAAEKASGSAQAATDRLNVALENLQESIGNLILPQVTALADALGSVASAAQFAVENVGKLGNIDLGPLGKIADIAKFSPLNPLGFIERGKAVAGLVGIGGGGGDKAPAPGLGIETLFKTALEQSLQGERGFGALGPTRRLPAPTGELPIGIQNEILRAENANDRGALLKSLLKARSNLEEQLTRETVTPKLEREIRSNLETVQSAIQGIFAARNAEAASVAAAAKATADKASDEAKRRADEFARRQEEAARKFDEASRKMKEARLEELENARKAMEAAAEFAKRQADEFKSKALAALDRKQGQLDTSRALTDAQKALARARQIGGAATIQAAQRDLEDAKLARQRFLVEGATVSRASSGFNITGSTFVFNNVQNVREFLEALRKISSGGAAQSRGRHDGRNLALS